jgi:nucleoid DNA-binding protein
MIRTKNDIIKKLMGRYGLDSANARQVVSDVLSGIVDAALEHGRIEIRRFGTFRIAERASRVARNPRTNEPLRLPARHVLTFEPSDKVVDRIASRYQDGTAPQPERFTFSNDA